MAEGRFLYFLSGVSVGVGAALLCAPRSGAETRAALRDKASETEDYVRRQTDEIRNTITDTMQRGKEAARVTRDGTIEALEEGKAILQRG